MKVIAIIPARMNSSRFPGKPLAKINNKEMIKVVYENVSKSNLLNKVVVATCDKEIYNFIISIGGEAIMTSIKHQRASDRCAEAIKKIEKKERIKFDIAVMAQGDEPLINKNMIQTALTPMIKNPKINVINLIGLIKTKNELNDKNCIKVVFNNKLEALYFSRSPIPNSNIFSYHNYYKQICVIPFRRKFLDKYLELRPTKLEINESIDMMRILEHGYNVNFVKTNYHNQSVDTPSDIKKVEKFLKYSKYK